MFGCVQGSFVLSSNELNGGWRRRNAQLLLNKTYEFFVSNRSDAKIDSFYVCHAWSHREGKRVTMVRNLQVATKGINGTTDFDTYYCIIRPFDRRLTFEQKLHHTSINWLCYKICSCGMKQSVFLSFLSALWNAVGGREIYWKCCTVGVKTVERDLRVAQFRLSFSVNFNFFSLSRFAKAD